MNEEKTLEEQIKEDFKRKDWSSQDWMNSPEDIDRLIWLIISFSPHNLWKAREAIRSELQKHDALLIARIEKLPDYEIKSTMYEKEILIHKDDVLKLIRGVQAT